MKKVYSIILSIVLIFVLTISIGCNDERIIELEKALGEISENIKEYESEKSSLLEEINNLKVKIEELEKQNGNTSELPNDYEEHLNKIKEKLEEIEKNESSQNENIEEVRETLVGELETLIEDFFSLNDSMLLLNDELQEISKKIIYLENKFKDMSNKINITLADEYYLVVGDVFQLYYRSIIQAPDPYGYYIKLDGTKGHAYNRYYEFIPTSNDIGTYNLKVSVCDANGTEYGSASTKLIVSSNKISSSENTEKTILCFGDSLTANGIWVAQGIKRAQSAGYTNIKTIGSHVKSYNGVTVNYQGHSGWYWTSFLEGYGTGADLVNSPFKSTTSNKKISFKDFATKHNVSTIDELYILLTWNAIGGSFKEFNFSGNLASAKEIIDIYHEEFPNGKVTLIGIPKPSTNAGLGAYYEVGTYYGDNYAQTVTAMNYNEFLQKWCNMPEYSSFMRYIDGMGQFDSEYNMPSEAKPVNPQSTVTEKVGNAMGMHPNENGYRQLGDIFYRALMKKW